MDGHLGVVHLLRSAEWGRKFVTILIIKILTQEGRGGKIVHSGCYIISERPLMNKNLIFIAI